MNRTVQIGAVAAALATGVVVGAFLFRADRAPEPPRIEKAARTGKGEAKGKDKEAFLKDLKDQLGAESKTTFEVADNDVKSFGWRIPHQPRTVAGLLGLDAARQKTLEETVIAILDEGERMATATEPSDDGKGFSGWCKGPQDMAVAPYSHLLKK
jgi:hypothetical protein